MKSKHEKKVEKLSYKFQIMLDSKVEQIETQASENISDMQRVYQNQQQKKLKKSMGVKEHNKIVNNKINELESQHHNKINSLTKEYEEELHKLNDLMTEELQKINLQHDKELKQERALRDKMISELKKSKQKTSAKKSTKEDNKKYHDDSLEMQVQSLQKRLQDARE